MATTNKNDDESEGSLDLELLMEPSPPTTPVKPPPPRRRVGRSKSFDACPRPVGGFRANPTRQTRRPLRNNARGGRKEQQQEEQEAKKEPSKSLDDNSEGSITMEVLMEPMEDESASKSPPPPKKEEPRRRIARSKSFDPVHRPMLKGSKSPLRKDMPLRLPSRGGRRKMRMDFSTDFGNASVLDEPGEAERSPMMRPSYPPSNEYSKSRLTKLDLAADENTDQPPSRPSLSPTRPGLQREYSKSRLIMKLDLSVDDKTAANAAPSFSKEALAAIPRRRKVRRSVSLNTEQTASSEFSLKKKVSKSKTESELRSKKKKTYKKLGSKLLSKSLSAFNSDDLPTSKSLSAFHPSDLPTNFTKDKPKTAQSATEESTIKKPKKRAPVKKMGAKLLSKSMSAFHSSFNNSADLKDFEKKEKKKVRKKDSKGKRTLPRRSKTADEVVHPGSWDFLTTRQPKDTKDAKVRLPEKKKKKKKKNKLSSRKKEKARRLRQSAVAIPKTSMDESEGRRPIDAPPARTSIVATANSIEPVAVWRRSVAIPEDGPFVGNETLTSSKRKKTRRKETAVSPKTIKRLSSSFSKFESIKSGFLDDKNSKFTKEIKAAKKKIRRLKSVQESLKIDVASRIQAMADLPESSAKKADRKRTKPRRSKSTDFSDFNFGADRRAQRTLKEAKIAVKALKSSIPDGLAPRKGEVHASKATKVDNQTSDHQSLEIKKAAEQYALTFKSTNEPVNFDLVFKKKSENLMKVIMMAQNSVGSGLSLNKAEDDPITAGMMRAASPANFICPICSDMMKDPVRTSVGSTYERQAIQWWLRDHDTDPLTQQKMADKNLDSDNVLRETIQTWKEDFQKNQMDDTKPQVDASEKNARQFPTTTGKIAKDANDSEEDLVSGALVQSVNGKPNENASMLGESSAMVGVEGKPEVEETAPTSLVPESPVSLFAGLRTTHRKIIDNEAIPAADRKIIDNEAIPAADAFETGTEEVDNESIAENRAQENMCPDAKVFDPNETAVLESTQVANENMVSNGGTATSNLEDTMDVESGTNESFSVPDTVNPREDGGISSGAFAATAPTEFDEPEEIEELDPYMDTNAIDNILENLKRASMVGSADFGLSGEKGAMEEEAPSYSQDPHTAGAMEDASCVEQALFKESTHTPAYNWEADPVPKELAEEHSPGYDWAAAAGDAEATILESSGRGRKVREQNNPDHDWRASSPKRVKSRSKSPTISKSLTRGKSPSRSKSPARGKSSSPKGGKKVVSFGVNGAGFWSDLATASSSKAPSEEETGKDSLVIKPQTHQVELDPEKKNKKKEEDFVNKMSQSTSALMDILYMESSDSEDDSSSTSDSDIVEVLPKPVEEPEKPNIRRKPMFDSDNESDSDDVSDKPKEPMKPNLRRKFMFESDSDGDDSSDESEKPKVRHKSMFDSDSDDDDSSGEDSSGAMDSSSAAKQSLHGRSKGKSICLSQLSSNDGVGALVSSSESESGESEDESDDMEITGHRSMPDMDRSSDDQLGDLPTFGSKEPRAIATDHYASMTALDYVQFAPRNFVQQREERFNDYYELGQLLGEGEFGEVFIGYPKQGSGLGEERAVKIIDKARMCSGDYEQVINEFNLLKGLTHPNILTLYGFFEDSSNCYIVTDICKGGELWDELYARGKFEEADAAAFMTNLLSAVKFLQSHKIVHRDLNLENILLEENKELDQMKIIDFGLATKYEDGVKLTDLVGKVHYVAPEVLEMSYEGSKYDVWSCGVVCFILLSGFSPFEGDTDFQVMEQVTLGLNEAVFKDPAWENITEEAKDFVRHLLTYEQEERPTAEQALKHAWIQNSITANKESFMQSYGQSSIACLENMQDFGSGASLALKQAVYVFIGSQLLAKDEREEIDKVFRGMDADCDGKLSKSDIKQGYERFFDKELSDVETDKMFNRINISKTGFIDYTEFVVAAMEKSKILDTEKLRSAFRSFDHGNKGYISAEDLKHALTGVIALPADNEDDADGIIQKMMTQVDVEGDGKISFQNFTDMMMFTGTGTASTEVPESDPRTRTMSYDFASSSFINHDLHDSQSGGAFSTGFDDIMEDAEKMEE